LVRGHTDRYRAFGEGQQSPSSADGGQQQHAGRVDQIDRTTELDQPPGRAKHRHACLRELPQGECHQQAPSCHASAVREPPSADQVEETCPGKSASGDTVQLYRPAPPARRCS
jgi:hypothetical protein